MKVTSDKNKKIIIEIEAASNVKDFIARNPDVTFKWEGYKPFINKADDDALLKVTKKIEGSHIMIIRVHIADEESLKDFEERL